MCAGKCFQELRESFKLCVCAFDGDVSTYKHFYSNYPDAMATRDPNHIVKNVYKQLLSIYGQLKNAWGHGPIRWTNKRNICMTPPFWQIIKYKW